MTIQQMTNSIKNRAKKIYKWCGNNLGTIIVVSAGIFIATAVYLKSKSKNDQQKKQPETNKQKAQPKPVVHVHEHWVYNITPLLEGIGSLLNSLGEYIKSRSNVVVAEEVVDCAEAVAVPEDPKINSIEVKAYSPAENIINAAVGWESKERILAADYDAIIKEINKIIIKEEEYTNDLKINLTEQVKNKLILTSFWQRMYHWSNAKYCLNPNAPEMEIVKPIVKQETATPVRLEEEDDGAGVYAKERQQAKRDPIPSAPRISLSTEL